MSGGGGQLIRMAACPVPKARETCRLVVRALVDDAGGVATPGSKPRVRAYPGQQGLNVARALRVYANSPETSPTTAAWFSQFLPVVDAGMATLVRAGIDPCLVVGTYDVERPPDDHDEDRPAQIYADGRVVRELYLGAPR